MSCQTDAPATCPSRHMHPLPPRRSGLGRSSSVRPSIRHRPSSTTRHTCRSSSPSPVPCLLARTCGPPLNGRSCRLHHRISLPQSPHPRHSRLMYDIHSISTVPAQRRHAHPPTPSHRSWVYVLTTTTEGWGSTLRTRKERTERIASCRGPVLNPAVRCSGLLRALLTVLVTAHQRHPSVADKVQLSVDTTRSSWAVAPSPTSTMDTPARRSSDSARKNRTSRPSISTLTGRDSPTSIRQPQRKTPVVYPALLSRVAQAFRERIPIADHVKDSLTYKDAFDGREAVDKIAYIIKTTDRNLALLLGRALDAQKFFHDVTYDHRLRDSPHELYQFRTKVRSSFTSGDLKPLVLWHFDSNIVLILRRSLPTEEIRNQTTKMFCHPAFSPSSQTAIRPLALATSSATQ